jgi:hypothetical protein
VEKYCEIFVLGPEDQSQLEELVGRIIGGHANLGTINGTDLSLDVRKNDDFDPEKSEWGVSQFLHFPYYLEVEPADPNRPIKSFVAAVGELLDGLRESGQRFVTASDFEDQLRDNGASPPRQISSPGVGASSEEFGSDQTLMN